MRRALLAALACSAGAVAQAPDDVLRLFSPTNTQSAHLVDTNGTIVHTWNTSFQPGLAVYLDESNGDLVRTIRTPGQFIAGGTGGGVQRLDFDGTVTWQFNYDTLGNRAHHDIEIMPNGNVLMIAWERFTNAEAIAHGRNPAWVGTWFRPDHIIEVEPTGPTSGNIVWEWHVWDHVIQDLDPTKANFGVVADHPELIDLNYPGGTPQNGDWNHCNSVEYDPVHDWIIISSRRQDEIWIIDHSTTTAEAAGHTGGNHGKGGDLLYRWGNPAAYDAGTVADKQLEGQHCAVVIPDGYPGAGNVTIFNNNGGAPTASEVLEITLPLDGNGDFIHTPGTAFGPAAPVWSVSGNFGSSTQSGAERLPNGNTLIASANQQLLQEVSPSGQVVWSYNTPGVPFHAHHVNRTLWTDTTELSIASGGVVTFDLLAGTDYAGENYFLLGSASGTSPGIPIDGQVLPLNFDGWTITLLSNPNVFPFGNTYGTLDAQGRATATFTLPGGIFPPEVVGVLHFDHAYGVIDAANTVLRTSNPVPLDFTN